MLRSLVGSEMCIRDRSQWPAVSIQQQTSAPTSTSYSGGQPQQNYTHNASRRVDQSNQQQQGYVSKKPAPLVEDEVYPNVPTDPTFMNGLSRRSRSRGPGGGRRKSVGEEDAHITSCLLYTSDAADEEDSVVLGGCTRIMKTS
eukprot:TRINITY_DN30385_c0_g1_i1.p1 TRINITY_DN30385_c0_g1~~TRINITY_DN30385_c0_g1_i1.p1  ORF type:complete len:156 (+),score=47.77 TRINITY_DN30385_c0_g1_i1:42-470(+)